MQHDEPHPLLAEADTPSFATLKTRAIHKIAEELNTLGELFALLKGLQGIKPCDKWGPQYSPDDWYRMILHHNFAGARAFLLSNHS